MSQEQAELTGPDLTQGIALSDIADGGKLLGQAGGEQVLVVRSGSEVFAIGAHCSHYHAPLADGVVVDGAVRCPWHHACFDLRTGEATRAPAIDPIACYSVEQRDGKVFVGEKRDGKNTKNKATAAAPAKSVCQGCTTLEVCGCKVRRVAEERAASRQAGRQGTAYTQTHLNSTRTCRAAGMPSR